MVQDAVTALNIVKPALPGHLANCVMVSSAINVTIGFMLLALAGKSLAILPIDKWNPKYTLIKSTRLLQVSYLVSFSMS
jgi:uncharacterized membrane protein YbhN (UPF0104 family)